MQTAILPLKYNMFLLCAQYSQLILIAMIRATIVQTDIVKQHFSIPILSNYFISDFLIFSLPTFYISSSKIVFQISSSSVPKISRENYKISDFIIIYPYSIVAAILLQCSVLYRYPRFLLIVF